LTPRRPTPSAHWSEDSAQLDLLLDRELPPEVLCLREAEAAADPAVGARVEARAALLRALARAKRADHSARALDLPGRAAQAELEGRIVRSLAASRDGEATAAVPRRGFPWTWAAAAALLLGAAAALIPWEGSPLVPLRAEAACAAGLLRDAAASAEGGACGGQTPTSPYRFALVERRELRVRGCLDSGSCVSAERALLGRPDGSEVMGYVAVASPARAATSEIGVTRLEDVVVFDVHHGGVSYYLAVRREVVDRRGTCAACHQEAMRAERSPHRLEERIFSGS
jgi:hypothetical protein